MKPGTVQSLSDIGLRLDRLMGKPPATEDAAELLSLGEEILEHWVRAKGKEPTQDRRDGFRLMAMHRQGADKDPSFNACRETCRELVYLFNLLTQQTDHPDVSQRARMMAWVTNHLYLFIAGKMETQQLGDFCCASRPLREKVDAEIPAQ